MELLAQFIDIVLHLDRHLNGLVAAYGNWIYLILFVIIFCETGLVVAPFLPGDSLLFVAGALASSGSMDVHGLFALLVLAAFCGDNSNYWIGRFLGPRLFRYKGWLKQENLDRTHAFMERHGPKAIVIARFVPVVRTFVPFVSGLGRLTYLRFLGFSVLGALLWVGLLLSAGYFFGNLTVVKNNLSAVLLLIVGLSILPGVIEYFRQRAPRQEAR